MPFGQSLVPPVVGVLLVLGFTAAAAPAAAESVDKASPGSASPVSGRVSSESYLSHVRFLASDDLEGRGIGTPGIDRAAEYIAEQFRKSGLRPGGENGTFFQTFDLNLWKKIGPETRLTFERKAGAAVELKLNEDWTPLPWTADGDFTGEVVFAGYGIVDEEKDYDDYAGLDVKGKVVLMLRYEPTFMLDDPSKPDEHTRHSQFRSKSREAMDRDAAAVLIVNPEPAGGKAEPDALYPFGHGATGGFGVPMLQLTRAAADRLLAAGGQPEIVALQKRIESSKKPASDALSGVSLSGRMELPSDGPRVRNVIGVYPGRGAAKDEYVVVGGHYDHLGRSASMWNPTGPVEIHNGADDNASGTAGVIEAARLIAGGGAALERSVVFMAFSAEESGLLGSDHFAKSPTLPIDKVIAMINMDMIGRMRDGKVQIGGQRTGDGLADLVQRRAGEMGLTVVDGGGGRGPSDHTSFYNKDIPVLFLTTGLHKQYHKPDDDTELINSGDGARVAQLAAELAGDLASAPTRLAFHEDAGSVPFLGDEGIRGRGRPRLGIVPDEDDEPGVIIRELSDDMPAQKAGLAVNDRIVRIAGKKVRGVDDLGTIMGDLKSGGTAEVEVLRGDETKIVTLEFPAGGRGARGELAGIGRGRRGRDGAGRNGEDRSDRDGSRGDKADGAETADAKSKDAAGDNPHSGMREDAPPMPQVRLGIAPSYAGGDGKPGFVIEYVVKGGAAEKAGMRDTDRILTIGGRKVSDVYSYMAALQKFKPGDEIPAVVLRDGKEVELTIKAAGGRPGAS